MVEHLESENFFSNIRNQLIATLIANLIILSHGCTLGWFSPSLPILLSDETPLSSSGPLSNDQLSWIGSISGVGSVCGTFLFGFISWKMSAKTSMAFMSFPPVVFWILVRFGSSFHHILIARFFAGLTGGGFQTGTVLFVSEISNNNIRGRLGSLTPLTRNLGVLIAFFIGSYVEYEYVPYVFVFIPAIYLILLLTLPNTPQWYLREKSPQKAEHALTHYKGLTGKNDCGKIFLREEFARLKTIEEERKNSPKAQCSDFTNRTALKGLIISVALSWFSQATGCYIIMNYSSLIFEKSGSALSISTSSIILAAIQIVGGLVSSALGDTFGRKKTMNISLIGSIVGLLTLSGYLYLRQSGSDVSNYTWLPIICLSFIIFITSSGIIAITNTCIIENIPPKIRTAGMTWYSLFNNFMAFVGDKFFPILLEIIHLHGFFILLAINCCAGLIFIASMKETKGKSLDSSEPNCGNSKL